jgi:glycosyltransferase involved in cell wall biosynthesis
LINIEPKFKVDVVLLTKDSMKPCLRRCAKSIYANVPVNRLIVVDGGSTDGTLECLRQFDNVEIVFDLKGNRATARQIAIGIVETEWFMFVDSDCILCDAWFEKAKEKIASDVGAVQGHDYPIYDKVISDFNEAMVRLRQKLGRKGSRALLPSYVRGFTGDVLIRTKTIRDIKIPKMLHFYEDYYIKRHIESKGFAWVITKEPNCLHVNVSRKPMEYYHSGYIGYKVGFLSLKKSLLATIVIFPKVLYALTLKQNLNMALPQIRFQLFSLVGVIKAWMTDKKK